MSKKNAGGFRGELVATAMQMNSAIFEAYRRGSRKR